MPDSGDANSEHENKTASSFWRCGPCDITLFLSPGCSPGGPPGWAARLGPHSSPQVLEQRKAAQGRPDTNKGPGGRAASGGPHGGLVPGPPLRSSRRRRLLIIWQQGKAEPVPPKKVRRFRRSKSVRARARSVLGGALRALRLPPQRSGRSFKKVPASLVWSKKLPPFGRNKPRFRLDLRHVRWRPFCTICKTSREKLLSDPSDAGTNVGTIQVHGASYARCGAAGRRRRRPLVPGGGRRPPRRARGEALLEAKDSQGRGRRCARILSI